MNITKDAKFSDIGRRWSCAANTGAGTARPPPANENTDVKITCDSTPARRNVDPVSPEKENRAPKRTWKSTVDLDAMAAFQCCKSLQCVNKFVLGKADVNRLRIQQEDFARCSSYKERTAWVTARVPMEKLSRTQGSMEVGKTFVCNKFFAKAFGVSNNTIEAAKRNPRCPANRRPPVDPLAGERDRILAFLDYEADRCGQHMPDKDATYLYLRNKKELYEVYRDEMLRVHGPLTITSASYFNNVWRHMRPKLAPKTGGQFMKCNECTLFQATLNGSPGIRMTADAELIAKTEAKKAAHIKKVALDRQRIASIKEQAQRAKADLDPLRCISLMVDAADQHLLALPMLRTWTHGTDRGWTERQKILGVVVEGQFVEVFLKPQTVGGGSNLICTAIHRTLTRLFELHTASGKDPYIAELFIQVDNCVGENKNHILVGYMGSLVARGVIGRVEINFMMVGHTHILIDQIFSRFAILMKERDLFTRAEQAKAFSEAYRALKVFTTTLRSCGNFKDVVHTNGRVRTIHGITKPRSFELVKHGRDQATVGMKEFMHSPKFTGLSANGIFDGAPHELFNGIVPLVEQAPPCELKVVDDATIRNIKIRYESVFPRVEALFPCDKVRQAQTRAEMMRSVELLKASGSCKWDLPGWWLPRREETTANGSDTAGCSGVDRGPLGRDGDNTGENGERGRNIGGSGGGPAPTPGPGDELTRPDIQVGYFVFILAPPTSFLVGHVLEVVPAGEGEEEHVRVHWWSPVNKTMRNNPGGYSIQEYGGVTFGADFLPEEAEVHGKKKRRVMVKDIDCEPVSRVSVSCKKFNGNGKRIPKSVLDRLQKMADELPIEQST